MINSTVNPPKIFWAVAVFALFYSITGILSFLSECFVTDEIYNVLTDDEYPLLQRLFKYYIFISTVI